MRTSCAVSRRPQGALAPPTRTAHPGSPLPLPPGWPLAPAGWRERQRRAAETRGKHGAAADLTRGPLAAAPSGLCGDLGGRPIAGRRTAAAPCQIRRSVIRPRSRSRLLAHWSAIGQAIWRTCGPPSACGSPARPPGPSSVFSAIQRGASIAGVRVGTVPSAAAGQGRRSAGLAPGQASGRVSHKCPGRY